MERNINKDDESYAKAVALISDKTEVLDNIAPTQKGRFFILSKILPKS
ncbi:hypothetical protein MWH25_11515 [Natroniella acetigena]|nr:hypothetical protein [Natroniella acetigena]MCK8828353.1 hypothetical protein [Natroniella acetigena]